MSIRLSPEYREWERRYVEALKAGTVPEEGDRDFGIKLPLFTDRFPETNTCSGCGKPYRWGGLCPKCWLEAQNKRNKR